MLKDPKGSLAVLDRQIDNNTYVMVLGYNSDEKYISIQREHCMFVE